MKQLSIFLASIFLVTPTTVVKADLVSEVVPKELNWKTYNTVSLHASQMAEEKQYLDVDWKDTLYDAQREAFKKDKPIVMILFFGDHRSNC